MWPLLYSPGITQDENGGILDFNATLAVGHDVLYLSENSEYKVTV